MPTIADLRSANPWADDVSDLELLNYRAQQTGTSLEDAAKAFGVKYNPNRNAASAGFSAGVDELQGLGYGVLGAGARAVGLDSAANWADKNVRINSSEARFNGRPDLENIEDQTLGSMPGYLVYQGAKQLPILAGTVAGAAVMPEAVIPAALSRGLAFAPRAVGGGGLSSAALDAAGGYAAKKALTNEAMAAGNQFARIGATSYPMSVASLYNEAVERGDPTQGDALAAFAGGVPYAAGEAVMPAIVNRGLRTGGLGFTGNMPTRMAKAAGVDALGEAGTELFQNEIEMGFAGPLTDEQKFSRRLNSAVAGGLVGGMYGAPAGIRGTRSPVEPGQESDLLGGNGYPALPSPNQMPIYADNRAYPGVETVVDEANQSAAAQRATDELWAARNAYDNRFVPPGTQMGLALDGGQMGQIDPMLQAAAGPTQPEYDPANPVRDRRQMSLDFDQQNRPEVIYGNPYNPASPVGSDGVSGSTQAGTFTQLPISDAIRQAPDAQQQAATTVNGVRTVAQLKAAADQVLANNLITPDQHVEFMNEVDTNRKLKLLDKKALLTKFIEKNNGTQTQKAVAQQAGQQAAVPVPGPVNAAQPSQVAAQALQTEAAQIAPDGQISIAGKGVPLAEEQQRVVNYVQQSIDNNELDNIVDAQGKLRAQDIALALGIKNRGSVAMALKGARERIAAAYGVSVDEVKAGLKTLERDRRSVEDSTQQKLGLSPDQQAQGVDEDQVLGQDAAFGVVDTPAQAQANVDDGNRVESPDLDKEDPIRKKRNLEATVRRQREIDNTLNSAISGEAAQDWDDMKGDGVPSSDELDRETAFAWVLAYTQWKQGEISENELAEEQRDLERQSLGQRSGDLRTEQNSDRLTGDGAGVRRPFASATSVSGTPVQSTGTTSGQAKSLTNAQNQKLDDRRRSGDQGQGMAGVLPGVSSSGVRKSEGTGEAEEPTTVERISKQLRALFFSGQRFDNKVTVVNTAEDLPEGVRQSANPDGFTQAFVMPNGKAYMIASRIEKGQELAVFLHEVGVHLGMEGLIGGENFTNLAKQIGKWSSSDANTLESRLAKLALARTHAAANTAQQNGSEFGETEIAHELIAYFVEEAVNAGVNPTAVGKAGGPIYNWFRTMWAGVKVALRKFGLDRVDNLTAKNIVDLAYGAALLELDGTWHGTAADFRNFDHDYMGTGEGAQAFGWGTYLAQRVGIAKGYWQNDIERKSRPTTKPIAWKETSPTKDVTVHAGIDNFGKDISIVGLQGEWSVTNKAGVVGKFDSLEKAKRYAEYSGQAVPEGSLMRTSVAATEDEMLNWDKTFSEQSEFVRNAMNDVKIGNRPLSEYPSMEAAYIYQALADKMGPKEASMYLDSLGVKGIQFLDQPSRKKVAMKRTPADLENTIRGAKMLVKVFEQELAAARSAKEKESAQRGLDDQLAILDRAEKELEKNKGFVPTRNLVVFNDKNIVRAVTYQGADRGKVRFSSRANTNPSTPDGFFAKMGEHIDDLVSNPAGGWSKIKLGWMTLEQIADRVKSNAVKAYTSVMTEMQRYSKHIIYQAALIDQDWSKLSTNTRANLSSIMRDATRMGFDPEVDTASSADQQVLKDRFNKTLTKEARDVYRRVRDHYKQMFEERKQILTDAAANGTLSDRNKAEVDKMFTEVKGPYFPLMRLGNWYAVGMSKELAALQAKVDAGEATAEEQDRYRTLRKDKAHYITKSFDTRREAKRFSKDMAGQYDQTYFNTAKSVIDNAVKSTPDLAKMQDYLTAGMPQGARDDLNNMLAQMYFDMLPDSSPLKRMMKREGVYGEEEDMRKVFAASSISMAHHVSRLKYANKLSEHLVSLDKETKRNEGLRHVYNELVARANLATKTDDTPFADSMNQLSYFAHLGLSPAFILTNMTQVPMITAPWLTARYGFSKTKSALTAAYVDAYKIISGTMQKDGWEAEYNWSDLFKAGSNEDKLLNKLLEMNLIDITMEHDLGAVARIGGTGGSGNWNKAVKIASLPVRATEAANRIVTALSSYRLAMDKGMSHDDAVEHAAKAISETQLNYSALNAPRYMQSVFGSKALAKMVFQFRKYQQGMVYLIAKNAKDAFKGDREALKTLIGVMGTTGLMAGATGLPFAGSVFWMASVIGSAFDDDDEPFDARESFRNYLAEKLGDQFALAVSKGLPTLLGMDISGNIGMGNIGMPLPYVRDGKKPSDSMKEMLASAAGAPFGTMMEMADGFGELINGDIARGAQHVVPLKLAKNIIKAADFAAEGMVDSKGNIILPAERFDGWDIAFRAGGFTTTKESEYYEANSAMQKAKAAASDARNALLREYAEARMKGEPLVDFQEKIADFNTRHPEKGIRIDQSSLLKSVQARKKLAEERTETGLRRDKTMKPYLERGAFADGQ